MNNTTDSISEEIVVVGSCHGGLADVIKTLYDKEDPMEPKFLRETLGGDKVILEPQPNSHVPFAVSVAAQNTERLGFVWLRQALALFEWMTSHQISILHGRIKEFCGIADVVKITIDLPEHLPWRNSHANMDHAWGIDIPLVHIGITDRSLSMNLILLRDELAWAKGWTDTLQLYLDNFLKALPTNLSAHHSQECLEVYKMMRDSRFKEVREKSDILLRALIHQESEGHLRWWKDQWLPEHFKEMAKASVMDFYEAARFSLDRVEEMLHNEPLHLFHIYLAKPEVFAFRLLFASLPAYNNNRFLTLLGVRDAMLNKKQKHSWIANLMPVAKVKLVLRFFTHPYFNSLAGQERLRNVFYSIIPQLKMDTGRDWVAYYLWYHFYTGNLELLKNYVDFFSDLELLMPGFLTKVYKDKTGYARYKIYIDSMALETKRWFIMDEKLPPMNVWKSKTFCYKVGNARRIKIQGLVTDLFQGIEK